jgi:hypothetical protein
MGQECGFLLAMPCMDDAVDYTTPINFVGRGIVFGYS